MLCQALCKRMMEFSFGILAYNQENYILETLESIKYQKEHFGLDCMIDIILVDDASKDQTYNLVQYWINENRTLFRNVKMIRNSENQGTVRNFNVIINNISTTYFKIIAGDDLISSGNLFEKYVNLDAKSLSTFVRMEIKDGIVKLNLEWLKSYHYNMKKFQDRVFLLKAMRKGGLFHSPSTLFQKKLYINAKCSEYNTKFRLFEDDPTWYSMLKNEPKLNVIFNKEIIVLYRVHSKSVSNSNIVNSPFEKEMEQLKGLYYKDTKGLEKLFFWFALHNTLPKIFRLDKYISYLKRKKINFYARHDNEFYNFIALLKEKEKEEQKFYKIIRQNAQKYYRIL